MPTDYIIHPDAKRSLSWSRTKVPIWLGFYLAGLKVAPDTLVCFLWLIGYPAVTMTLAACLRGLLQRNRS